MSSKVSNKTCKYGHHFFKSSDCPVCPICEEKRKSKDCFFSILAAPARRALERENIQTLDDLTKYSEKEILSLHGMGKSSITILQKILIENRLEFKK